MPGLPFGTADPRSAETRFSTISQRLEELLGTLGAQAVMRRALDGARLRWPQLRQVTPRADGYDLSVFFSADPGAGSDSPSLEAASALRGLADSLNALLTCLLGVELTSELMSIEEAR